MTGATIDHFLPRGRNPGHRPRSPTPDTKRGAIMWGREHAYQAGCHQRRRRRGGSGTRGAGGGKANRSAFCRKRSHSSRVSVSCARNSSETARNVAICASRTGVRSGVAFGTTVSPVAGWDDRIDPVQFDGVNLVSVGSGARQLATFRRLNSPSVNLVIGSPK